MIKEVLTTSGFAPWALTSLMIFVLVFTLVLLWIFRKGAASQYNTIAQMPLEADTTSHVPSISGKE
ncbi:MAG: cbb3-type cytochrome c oxidase subunit 3 [SAR324 cluster bacterium]|nr:cbb3-type cytochrome c oxidase subunit 3 [SAR324 cluster bacterium]